MSDSEKKIRGRPPSSRSAFKTPKYGDYYVYSDNSDGYDDYSSSKKARSSKRKSTINRINRNTKVETNSPQPSALDRNSENSEDDCLSTYVENKNIYKLENDFNYLVPESISDNNSISQSGDEDENEIIEYRSPSPEEDIDMVENLMLPPSSDDLALPRKYIMAVVELYETIKHFSLTIRLSPYILEDFIAALMSNEQCALLAETHIALLKFLIREEDTVLQSTFGPVDSKDNWNIQSHFIDPMTWYELLRIYLESIRPPTPISIIKEYNEIVPLLNSNEGYANIEIGDRIKILESLLNLAMKTDALRLRIGAEGRLEYDDHCRNCHKLGDLICCETCSAVFHLNCVTPIMTEVPEHDWICNVCSDHKKSGISDCLTENERNYVFLREEPIGKDREFRKYWFLCRRIFIESDEGEEVIYYSTAAQFEELLYSYEHPPADLPTSDAILLRTLTEMRQEVKRQMVITEKLTTRNKLSNHDVQLFIDKDASMQRMKQNRMKPTEEIKTEDNSEEMKVTEDNSEEMKQTTDESVEIKQTKDDSEVMKVTEDNSEVIKQTEDNSEEVKQNKDESVEIKQTKDDSEEMKVSEVNSEELKQTEDISEDIKQAEDNSEEVKQTENHSEEIKQTKDDSEEMKQTKDDSEEMKQTKDDSEEMKQTKDDSEEMKQTRDDLVEMKETEDNSEELKETEDNSSRLIPDSENRKYSTDKMIIDDEDLITSTNNNADKRDLEKQNKEKSSHPQNDETFEHQNEENSQSKKKKVPTATLR